MNKQLYLLAHPLWKFHHFNYKSDQCEQAFQNDEEQQSNKQNKGREMANWILV